MKRIYRFEKKVIDVILNCIKDNQEYLTQKENLPQLAKLGYIYNTLWYAGRVSWGYDGTLIKEINDTRYEDYENPNLRGLTSEDISMGRYLSESEIKMGFKKLKSKGDCEDNPKYKIEMCDPLNEKIEDLIYDAWGMHISNDMNQSWDTFYETVINGKELTELDKLIMKENKTFDDWLEIKLHPDYRYKDLYEDKRSVANFLLCVIGNGYGYKDGYVIEEASGANQDSAMYGDWKNCTFRQDIQDIVNSVMSNKYVKKTVDASYYHIKQINDEYKLTENKKYASLLTDLTDVEIDGKTSKEITDLIESIMEGFKKKRENKEKVKKIESYYPICEYSIITMLDRNSHPSYLKIASEICGEIYTQSEKLKMGVIDGYGEKNDDNNYQYAIKNQNKFKEWYNTSNIRKELYKLESEKWETI